MGFVKGLQGDKLLSWVAMEAHVYVHGKSSPSQSHLPSSPLPRLWTSESATPLPGAARNERVWWPCTQTLMHTKNPNALPHALEHTVLTAMYSLIANLAHAYTNTWWGVLRPRLVGRRRHPAWQSESAGPSWAARAPRSRRCFPPPQLVASSGTMWG